MVKEKSMTYKDENGEKYRISYSEELQLKQLKYHKRLLHWQQMSFVVMLFLILVALTLLVIIVFVLYRLDSINFFTSLIWR